MEMTEEKKKAIALFRYGIISPIVTRQIDSDEYGRYFRNISQREFEYIDGRMIKLSETTARRWLKKYQSVGFDGLKPNGRSDVGKSRKLDSEVKHLVEYYVKEYPRLPSTQIYSRLIEDGTIKSNDVSLSTITRFVNKLKVNNKTVKGTEKKRYEKEFINEVWYGDTSYGPYIYDNGVKKRVYIIALIDDASRMIVGIGAFFEDNYVNLLKVIKTAVMTYGKPKMFSFDNGANFKSNQMKLLGARLGIAINYCAPRTPTSKAKIERWFRTMKDQWNSLIKPNDYKSLDEINESLHKYVQTYNNRPHKSLDNSSPSNRFFNDPTSIIRLNDVEIERSFLLEIERKVSADCVVVIDDQQFDVDYTYQNKKVQLRYAPDFSKVYIVNKEDNSLTEIKKLNKVQNSAIKRHKVKLVEDYKNESYC